MEAKSSLIERAKEVGFRRAALEHGALITDGPVPKDFQRGWGKTAFTRGKVAHYFTAYRNPAFETSMVKTYGDNYAGYYKVRSECGIEAHIVHRVPLFGPGNYPFCSRCENALMKRMVKEP